jgi:transcriptional regulator with XRE-family HTH domain
MKDVIRDALGRLDGAAFERLCCDLFQEEFSEYKYLEPNLNRQGKTRKGPMDAYATLEDGTYAVFLLTTQQDKISEKIRKDITDLNNLQTNFRQKITEVVIAVNSPIGPEVESYRHEVLKHGWRLREPLFSLERLTDILLRHKNLWRHLSLPISYLNAETIEEQLFDCGHRIREAREDLKLSISEFVEALQYSSERRLKKIEAREKEASISLITRISELGGISIDWLKHGNGARYELDSLSFYERSAIRELKRWKPQALYFCIELETYFVVLIAQLDLYKWKVFEVGFSLDIWEWIDEHMFIPEIYNFISKVEKQFPKILSSRICNKDNFHKLLSGEIHPRNAVISGGSKGRHWASDILDIYHRYPISPKYKAYGPWFLKAQEEFKRQIEMWQKA